MKQGYAAVVGDQSLGQLQIGLPNALPFRQHNTNSNTTIQREKIWIITLGGVIPHQTNCISIPLSPPSVNSFYVAVILGNRREVFTGYVRSSEHGVHTPGPFAY